MILLVRFSALTLLVNRKGIIQPVPVICGGSVLELVMEEN